MDKFLNNFWWLFIILVTYTSSNSTQAENTDENAEFVEDTLSEADSNVFDAAKTEKSNYQSEMINNTHIENITETAKSPEKINTYSSVITIGLECNLGINMLDSKSSFFKNPGGIASETTTTSNFPSPVIEVHVVTYSKFPCLNYVFGMSYFSTLSNYRYGRVGYFSNETNTIQKFSFIEIPIMLRFDTWNYSKWLLGLYLDAGISGVFLYSAKMTDTSHGYFSIPQETYDVKKDMKPFFIMPKIGVGFKITHNFVNVSFGVNYSTSIYSIVKDNISLESYLYKGVADNARPVYTYQNWQVFCSLSHTFSWTVKKKV